MDEYVTRPEHEEFKKRLEDEEQRQNKRLEVIENRVDKLIDMQASLAVMQAGIDNISTKMTRFEQELSEMKQSPADKWEKAKWIVISVVLTAIVAWVLVQMGISA